MGERNLIRVILIILTLGYSGSIIWLNNVQNVQNVQKKSIAVAQEKIASLGDINQDFNIINLGQHEINCLKQ